MREDVLLGKVAEGLKALATCYLKKSSTSTQQMVGPYMERLLLLQWRAKDVMSEFSSYYCLRLLVDYESPLASFFIDLFHELEWLLHTMQGKTRGGNSSSLNKKIAILLHYITPAADSCRYLFAISRISPTVCSQWLSTGKEVKREGKLHRDFSTDEFRNLTKMLSFINLDRQSNYNKVELGKMLGSGGYADVYKGHFVTRNHMHQPLQKIGEPVAVKVFRYGDCTESAGPCRSIGSQFFDQMEKMVELKTNGHNTRSMTCAGERLLAEELWKLVSAKHPNIVTARGYIGNRPQGESGLVMELMDTSLQEHLEKVKEPLKELEMIDLMLEIAKGMRFLHECDLVHKDLKPRNILLRSHKKLGRWKKYPAMEVKLADFGLTQYFVQDVQQSVVDTTPAGTYCYMAPEVLHMSPDYKASYQDKVDVFSYGTTCFNILTCEIPDALEFTCASSRAQSAEFYEAVKSSVWTEGVEGKPEYLIDLIARCWDFDPSRRPTFATICSVLQRAMLCILSPPVINVTTLSYFPHITNPKLWDLYRRIQVSRHGVIGTRMMDSCLEKLEGDIRECGHMRSNVSEDVTLFVDAWNKIRGTAGDILTQVGLNSWQKAALKHSEAAREELFAAMSLKQSEAASWEELFAAMDDEANAGVGAGVDADGFTTPVVRVQMEEPDRFWRIPLKTMDPQWILYKALVYNSLVDNFYYSPGVDSYYSFKNDRAVSDVTVDETLLPFLVCFWEGRAPKPSRTVKFLLTTWFQNPFL